jgi:hypothetical protein
VSETEPERLVTERHATHGSYAENVTYVQKLKDIMRAQPGWGDVPPPQREALDMIAHKTGRILHGQPDFADHWADIAGYAQCVLRILPETVETTEDRFRAICAHWFLTQAMVLVREQPGWAAMSADERGFVLSSIFTEIGFITNNRADLRLPWQRISDAAQTIARSLMDGGTPA